MILQLHGRRAKRTSGRTDDRSDKITEEKLQVTDPQELCSDPVAVAETSPGGPAQKTGPRRSPERAHSVIQCLLPVLDVAGLVPSVTEVQSPELPLR